MLTNAQASFVKYKVFLTTWVGEGIWGVGPEDPDLWSEVKQKDFQRKNFEVPTLGFLRPKSFTSDPKTVFFEDFGPPLPHPK